MPYIDIHTHQNPSGEGDLFIKNLFPSDEMELLPPGGFYSVGLHPWFITNNHSHREQLEALERRVALPEVVAVGECGLDKLANTESQLQLEVFLSQCRIAESVNKPLVIHCVKSYNEIFHLKRRLKPTVPWILHGYTGNDMITGQLVPQGFYFSLGKMFVHDEEEALRVAEKIPAGQLFFETDEWEKPVSEVYQRYARIKGIGEEELKEQIMWNFREVFIRQ
jgi:TatD DNase family protein